MQVGARRRALTEGVAAGAFFGTAAIFVRFVQGLDSFSIVFWRLLIACAALAAVMIFFGRSFQLRLVKEKLGEVLCLSFFLGVHFVFFTFSVRDTTILNATVLVSTAPVFSVLVSGLVFKVRPSRFALAGLMISFLGVCFIAYAETVAAKTVGQSVSPSLRGDLEAVGAAAVEALYLNLGTRVRRELNLMSAMLPIYAFSAAIVGLLSVPARNAISAFPFVAETALPLIGLGLLPTALAHTLYFSSLSSLKSFETATVALLEPVGATALGVAAFQEVPGPVFALGAVLVLVGVFFVVRNRSR